MNPPALGKPGVGLGRIQPADRWAALGLVLLVLFLFRQPVFQGTVFFERDVHLMWYTQVEAFVGAVTSGAWPVWNQFSGFGQPLWADANNQLLYPPTWLNLLMRPWTYYTGFVVAHFIFSGLGLHALARRLGISPLGSFAAATVWIAGGPHLSLAPMWNLLASAAWLPWMVLAGETALHTGTAIALLAWGATLAAPIITGAPEVAIMGFACSLTLDLRQRPLLGTLKRSLLAILFGLGLSAGQWLPSIEVAARSARRALPEAIRGYWSVHPWELLETLLPLRLHELPLRPELRSALFEPADPFLHSLYLGMPALGLILLGIQAGWPRRLLALGCLAALMAAGPHTPVYGWTVALLPPLKLFRFPAKAMILVALCWALAVGAGFDQAARGAESIKQDRARPLRWLPWLAVVALVLALGWRPDLLLSLVSDAPAGAESLARIQARLLGAAGGSVLVLLLLAATRLPAAGVRLAVVLAMAVELALAHQGLNPTSPRELYTYRPPLLDLLAPADSSRLYVFDDLRAGHAERYLGRAIPYRVTTAPVGWPVTAAQALGLRSLLFPPSAGPWGREGSYDADVPALQPLPLYQLGTLLEQVEGTPAHLRLLQLGAVSQVVSLHAEGLGPLVRRGQLTGPFPEPIQLFDVPGALPRAYAVSGVRLAGASGITALLDPGFEPAQELILAAGTATAPIPGFAGQVEVERLGADRVALLSRLSGPGYLVLVNAYDPGWRVEVDGRPSELLAANLVFCGVRLEAGTHRVELSYRPTALWWGLGLSGASLIAGAVIAIRRRSVPIAADVLSSPVTSRP